MRKKSVALTIIALLLMSSLAYLPKTQAYDSYIGVYIVTGCQSVTVTDNTNSSYTDTFTSTDIFEFDAADSLTFSAEAENGYVFSYWRLDNPGGGGWYDSTQNPYTASGEWVNNYDTITAVFVEPSISVSIDSPTATWYTESPTLSISYNAIGCTLDSIIYDLVWYGIQPPIQNDREYTTPVNLHIGNGQWSLNCTAYSSITGLTATDSVSFGVNIPNPTTYTITPSHDAGCTITPNTAQEVAEGGSQGFTYSADTGYNISQVLVDGSPVEATGSYTFTNVQADHTISVTSTPKIRYSNLAVSDTAANKTVTFSSYWTDETAPLVNYTFSTNNTGTWTNDTASAFSGTPAWANVSKTLNSTIGQIVGYQWFAVDSAGNWNSTAIQTLTTTGYNIIASNDLNSLLDPNGTITVCHGANQQFDFSALDGYTILKVIINGETEASTTSPYIFTNITSSQTISISTSDQIWYVNATSDTGCTVDPNGLQMIPAGTNASFTFSANIGYQLYKLYINGTETPSTNPYVFEPTGNTTLYITSLEIATGQPAAPGGGPVGQPQPTETTFPIPTPEVPPENLQFGILVIVGILLASYGLYSVDKKSKSKTWSKNKDIKSGEKWKKKK